MLYSILVGIALTAFTVAVHTLGTASWLQVLAGDRSLLRRGPTWWRNLRVLNTTVIVLLLLHIVEVTAWAMTYLAIPDITEVTTYEEAVYFSTVTFTTLGYGDITLTPPWRLLSGIEAMNGILLFGVSTAILLAIAQRLWNFSLPESSDSGNQTERPAAETEQDVRRGDVR
jgi:voltage-gated potassium channel Kch